MSDETILLVEDNEDDIFFMKRAFTVAGFSNPLRVVKDGKSAIAYFSGEGEYADREAWPMPCLVLLDLKLPFRTGIDVLRWVREQSWLDRLIVIVLTTSAEQRDIDEAYRLKANAYLVKPPNAAELAELMKLVKQFWLETNRFPTTCILGSPPSNGGLDSAGGDTIGPG